MGEAVTVKGVQMNIDRVGMQAQRCGNLLSIQAGGIEQQDGGPTTGARISSIFQNVVQLAQLHRARNTHSQWAGHGKTSWHYS